MKIPDSGSEVEQSTSVISAMDEAGKENLRGIWRDSSIQKTPLEISLSLNLGNMSQQLLKKPVIELKSPKRRSSFMSDEKQIENSTSSKPLQNIQKKEINSMIGMIN